MHAIVTRAVVPARSQRGLLVGVEVRVPLGFDEAARQRVLWSEPGEGEGGGEDQGGAEGEGEGEGWDEG